MLTYKLKGDLTTPGTVCLAHDSERALAVTGSLPLVITLKLFQRVAYIPELNAVLDTRDCCISSSLCRSGFNNGKPLREGEGHNRCSHSSMVPKAPPV